MKLKTTARNQWKMRRDHCDDWCDFKVRQYRDGDVSFYFFFFFLTPGWCALGQLAQRTFVKDYIRKEEDIGVYWITQLWYSLIDRQDPATVDAILKVALSRPPGGYSKTEWSYCFGDILDDAHGTRKQERKPKGSDNPFWRLWFLLSRGLCQSLRSVLHFI